MRYKITYKYTIHFPDPRESIVEIREMEIEVKNEDQLSAELKNFEARGCREVIKVEKMKKIKKQNLYIPYDLCLKMKDLGFEWITFDCYWIPDKNGFGFWRQNIKVPKILYDQAFAWFREKGIESYIAWDTAGFYKYVIVIKDGIDYYFDSSAYILYEGYEDARLKCLEKLIEIYEKL